VSTLRKEFSCPHPAEFAVFVKAPSPAAAFYDLHAPMVIVRGDCDEKCNGSGHHYPAKDSIEKHASHFVPFGQSVIAARLHKGPALRDLKQASKKESAGRANHLTWRRLVRSVKRR
jgi:hypothetical protein